MATTTRRSSRRWDDASLDGLRKQRDQLAEDYGAGRIPEERYAAGLQEILNALRRRSVSVTASAGDHIKVTSVRRKEIDTDQFAMAMWLMAKQQVEAERKKNSAQ